MPFTNEPWLDFSQAADNGRIDKALQDLSPFLGKTYPLIIDGREETASQTLQSINPSRLSEVVGTVSQADENLVDHAVDAALKAFDRWRFTAPEERADYLRRVAAEIRKRRDFFTALVIKEAGKNRAEADGDVCEAIDFLEFYAHEMIRLGTPYQTQDYPGEVNQAAYISRGVAAVIAPWNFPLAILTGMTAAALVTGNTVVMKPASQTPVIGYHLIELFQRAGLPPGALNLVVGPGDSVGQRLAASPKVSLVAFTGSKDVGLQIVKLAGETHEGQRQVKRVIGEFGGKNAVIVDETADLQAAAQGIAASAYGYTGQKCSAASRVIALPKVYKEVLERVVEQTKQVKIGPAEDRETFMGPVISREQLDKIKRYIEIGKGEGAVALEIPAPDLDGHFIGPMVFSDVPPDARIAREEIFGPVVSFIKARDLDEALRIANSTPYALTGGIYSRNRNSIERFKREIDAGNRYVNRKITGSIVQRQPFGGYKMSGVGSKAGGRDYLPQFMIPVSIAEYTG